MRIYFTYNALIQHFHYIGSSCSFGFELNKDFEHIFANVLRHHFSQTHLYCTEQIKCGLQTMTIFFVLTTGRECSRRETQKYLFLRDIYLMTEILWNKQVPHSSWFKTIFEGNKNRSEKKVSSNNCKRFSRTIEIKHTIFAEHHNVFIRLMIRIYEVIFNQYVVYCSFVNLFLRHYEFQNCCWDQRNNGCSFTCVLIDKAKQPPTGCINDI